MRELGVEMNALIDRLAGNSSNRAVVALVVANAVTLLSLLIFPSGLGMALIIYWAEGAIVGAFAIRRMFNAGEEQDRIHIVGRIFFSLFFIVHYGGFWAFPGIVVAAVGGLDVFVDNWLVFLPLIPLTVSHGISYRTNYIERDEWRKTDIMSEMIRPYKRFLALYLGVPLAFAFVAAIGNVYVGLILLATAKTAIDLAAHRRDHNKRAADSEEQLKTSTV